MGTQSIADVTSGEIRAEMARRRLTQRELAELLGWSQIYLWRRLNGKVRWSLEDVAGIALVLDVPVQKLTTRSA